MRTVQSLFVIQQDEVVLAIDLHLMSKINLESKKDAGMLWRNHER